jgi:hypothetical protein
LYYQSLYSRVTGYRISSQEFRNMDSAVLGTKVQTQSGRVVDRSVISVNVNGSWKLYVTPNVIDQTIRYLDVNEINIPAR